MKVVFCTTCKGRANHIKQTLPRNLADNPNSTFVLLDYSSQDDLVPYLKACHAGDIESGRLIVYSFQTDGPFHVSHAKNMAARLGLLEGAGVLVTLDADNFAGHRFDSFVQGAIEPGVILCPNYRHIKSIPHGPLRPARGYAGRLVIRAQDFIKMGGYCETFDTWRGEDIDLICRLGRLGYERRFIENRFLNAIPHGADVRFKEYPHAKKFENEAEWKVINSRTDTVVNYGKWGCGSVRRNFGSKIIELGTMPTRVFGIGLHRTATRSLHAAFKIMGYDSFHWQSNVSAWLIWDEMSKLGRSVILERSYALCDLPIPMLYRELDAAYPGSKFILTVRDEAGWIKSVERLWDPGVNPHYDWDTQPYSDRIHKALYGRTDFDSATFLARYRRHNAEVIEYFKDRPDDVLVMNMESSGDRWPELCGFLGQAVPKFGYPMVTT